MATIHATTISQQRSWKRRTQLTGICVSIVANSLVSGGIFTFPLLAPALVQHMHLSQPQLSAVAIAGMMGQYPFAALIGYVIDRFGPAVCSLLAGVLFFGGFWLFQHEINSNASPALRYYLLILGFGLLGLGAVSSYFSSLLTASKNFPRYSGIAAGTSMALFGLSPLFLSFVASTWFTDPVTGLNVTDFARFVAVLAGVVHASGALFLRILPQHTTAEPPESVPDIPASSDERTALIPKPHAQPESLVHRDGQSIITILSDIPFLTLFAASLCVLGICEMLIANIATLTMSLPLPVTTLAIDSGVNVPAQVRIISVANTLSRFVSGFVADVVSPASVQVAPDVIAFPRKHYISRVFFLCTGAVILATSLAWMLTGAQTQQTVWVLSLGAGAAYGSTWTIIPGLIAAIYGQRSFGRNFGIISYNAFIGTPVFTALYAAVTASHTGESEDGICHGKGCWRLTFIVCEACICAALVAMVWLWKVWKGRV